MTRPPPSDEQRQRARDAVSKAKADRAAQREEIAAGVFIYPDAPPGVGWILDVPGRTPRFYATKAAAIDAYGKDLL